MGCVRLHNNVGRITNAPSTFQRDMYEIFGPYLTDFMRVLLDDLSMFGSHDAHLDHLRKCFQKCRDLSFSLNSLKCAFAVQSNKLLGHIILKDGIAVDLDKVAVIMQDKAPETPIECSQFLGQIRWHGRHSRFLAHMATPLNVVAHISKKEFVWSPQCDLTYRRLKLQLSKELVMIPPDWGVEFHVFVDASNVAIGSVSWEDNSFSMWIILLYCTWFVNTILQEYWLGGCYSCRNLTLR